MSRKQRLLGLAMGTLIAVVVTCSVDIGFNVTLADDAEVVFTSVRADHNGDGFLDVADPIHLLEYIFLAGEDLALYAALPATGQTECYDNIAEIECDDPDFPKQDGAVQPGCNPTDRFVDNDDGTVTDTCSGLMWQQVTADPGLDYSADDNARLTWSNALGYCDDLNLAGHDGWRLPTVRELMSLVDYGVETLGDPAIDVTMFPEQDLEAGLSNRYWTSTSRAALPVLAWVVEFGGGINDEDDDQPPAGVNDTDSKLFGVNVVRAVRGGG